MRLIIGVHRNRADYSCGWCACFSVHVFADSPLYARVFGWRGKCTRAFMDIDAHTRVLKYITGCLHTLVGVPHAVSETFTRKEAMIMAGAKEPRGYDMTFPWKERRGEGTYDKQESRYLLVTCHVSTWNDDEVHKKSMWLRQDISLWRHSLRYNILISTRHMEQEILREILRDNEPIIYCVHTCRVGADCSGLRRGSIRRWRRCCVCVCVCGLCVSSHVYIRNHALVRHCIFCCLYLCVYVYGRTLTFTWICTHLLSLDKPQRIVDQSISTHADTVSIFLCFFYAKNLCYRCR
jgi:hypothetical protein